MVKADIPGRTPNVWNFWTFWSSKSKQKPTLNLAILLSTSRPNFLTGRDPPFCNAEFSNAHFATPPFQLSAVQMWTIYLPSWERLRREKEERAKWSLHCGGGKHERTPPLVENSGPNGSGGGKVGRKQTQSLGGWMYCVLHWGGRPSLGSPYLAIIPSRLMP